MEDFAVVGAGPAGSRFARRAAERGSQVTVFETGEIGRPLACSGHVSRDIWEFTPDGAREALFQNDIYGARFHLGDADSRAYPFYKDEPVSNAIDRVGLDKLLADAAMDAGADVRSGHTVTAVEEHDEHVTLEVKNSTGLETHQAAMVVGCDGPQSRVRSELGLPAPAELLHGVLGFDEDPDHQAFVDVHLTLPNFFAWRIPRGDAGVEYGLAARPGNDVAGRFDSLVADYDATISERCSGLIPIGPPETVTSERGFLIGDAASQTKPFTGGGILYGMRAADCAVRAINPSDPATLDAYETSWRTELQRDISVGHWIRRGYSVPEPIQRAGLAALSGKIGVHMDRPTSAFSVSQLKALFAP